MTRPDSTDPEACVRQIVEVIEGEGMNESFRNVKKFRNLGQS